MKQKAILLLAASAALIAAGVVAASAQARQPLPTVAKVDLDRYAGKWYEIARYPNRFQKKCVGDTTATYTRKPNGRVEVLNQCRTEKGMTNAKGEAKIVDASTNAKLEVRFAPSFLSWIPAVWGDYWIIDLDNDYKYVAIGEPKRNYFWILSRTPELDGAVYDGIIKRAEALGFDGKKVVKTPQSGK